MEKHTFGLKADHDTHNKFVSHLKVITSAVSLGHDASLIVFLGENDERQYLYPERFSTDFSVSASAWKILKISSGGDLKQALEAEGFTL